MSILSNAIAAQVECDRLTALFAKEQKFYRVPIAMNAVDFDNAIDDIGKTYTIQSDRFGLSEGVDLVLVGVDGSFLKNEMILTLWGNVPGPAVPYTTTGKAIEGYLPSYERYYRPELWQGDNGSKLTYAAFMRAPTQTFQFNATFFRDANFWFYLRRWNTSQNGFLLYIQDAAGDQWVGETLFTADHGIIPGDWFAFMMSVDYSAVGNPTVQIWVQKTGESVATDINNGPLWAADAGPLTFSFDDNTTVASVGAHPIETGNYCNIDVSEIYITNEAVDWSVEANRLKYVDSSGKPVGLGANGSDLTGTQPKHYAPDGDLSNNLGSESNWTEYGTISNSSTSPTD